METGNIKQALSELKQMMNMPMKCYTPSIGLKSSIGSLGVGGDENADPQGGGDKENEGKENTNPPMSPPADGDSIPEGDLPGQICRVLGKSEIQLFEIRSAFFWQIIYLWGTVGLRKCAHCPIPIPDMGSKGMCSNIIWIGIGQYERTVMAYSQRAWTGAVPGLGQILACIIWCVHIAPWTVPVTILWLQMRPSFSVCWNHDGQKPVFKPSVHSAIIFILLGQLTVPKSRHFNT